MSTLDELAAIWAAAPLPDGRWHPGGGEIARLDHAVRAAAAALAGDAAGKAALARRLDDAAPPPPGSDAGPEEPDFVLKQHKVASRALAEARALLARMPGPEGRHPYLDEILPALEAAELLLDAVALSPAAAGRFEALVSGRLAA